MGIFKQDQRYSSDLWKIVKHHEVSKPYLLLFLALNQGNHDSQLGGHYDALKTESPNCGDKQAIRVIYNEMNSQLPNETIKVFV